MKHALLTYLTVAIATFALATTAPAAQHQEGETPLGKAMDEMSGAFKKLARAMRSPNAADLADYKAHAATIKKHAVKAKDLMPELVAEAGDQKEAKMAAYQKAMTEFIATVDKLEKALAQGDLTQAKAHVDKLNAARKQGHKDFQKPDED